MSKYIKTLEIFIETINADNLSVCSKLVHKACVLPEEVECDHCVLSAQHKYNKKVLAEVLHE